ncbi:MAG: diacylglycerol kinase family protein [Syntrophomonadaceae bacterium]|nr:diacylglycerol kinase family protein [Syntrophomonadaceae bacterium]
MKSRNLRESFYYAFSGILYGFFRERNLKIHLLAAILAIFLGCFFGLTRIEWAILIFTIFLVFIAETINTAIEKTIDLVTSEYHPLAKVAKNLAAGAVLLSAINAVIMGIIIFGPYIYYNL